MDDRFDMLELDDEVKKSQPNANIFKNAGGLNVRDNATAKQDDNGTWFNAIGLESSEAHRHVAKVWQDKCTPLSDFVATVKKQSENKRDIVKPESEIRLKDAETLIDGTPLTKSGINSLRLFTDIPSSMLSFLEERGYQEDMVRYINSELDLREQNWANDGKEPRDFRVRIRQDDNGEDVIRAIVSERYGVIDNHEAMDFIADALPTLKDALASHLFNDGDDIYGNVLLPDHMKSEPDSDYGVGIAFRNSEIRNATFRVSPFLFRAICLNGMIWGRQNSEININQKHLGKIDTDSLRKEVQHAIAVALTQGNDLLTLMNHAKQVKVASPLSVIAQLSRDYKMTIDQGRVWHKGYLDSLDESTGDHNDGTVFGIVNGLSRSAQNYKGSVRESMETTASMILSPSIDADLQAISKRWGRIQDNANQLSEKTVNQYQYVAV
jgi:Domain of unknown function (DUF932)